MDRSFDVGSLRSPCLQCRSHELMQGARVLLLLFLDLKLARGDRRPGISVRPLEQVVDDSLEDTNVVITYCMHDVQSRSVLGTTLDFLLEMGK